MTKEEKKFGFGQNRTIPHLAYNFSHKNRWSYSPPVSLPQCCQNQDRSAGSEHGCWVEGAGQEEGKGVINVSQTQSFPSRRTFAPSSLSLRKLNDTPLVFLFSLPLALSPGCLCVNFKGLGLRGLAGSYGCREDSSGFTQGRVSPRGDSEMSASVSLCLSSKPCQRRLCPRSITALSLRVFFWLMIWDTQTVQLAPQPDSHHHRPSATLHPRRRNLTRHHEHKVKVSVMFHCVGLSVNAGASHCCQSWCMKAGRVTLPVLRVRVCVYVCVWACFEWQHEWGAARRRLFVKVHLPSLPTSPSWQQTVTADSPHKGRRGKGGRGYGD